MEIYREQFLKFKEDSDSLGTSDSCWHKSAQDIKLASRFVCLVSLRPRQQLGYIAKCLKTDVWQIYVLPHMRQRETMASVSAGHIILTPTQPVESWPPQRKLNPGLPHEESRGLSASYRAPLVSRWRNYQVDSTVSPKCLD